MSITSPTLAKKNLVTQDDKEGVTFRFQNYKTAKTYGSDTTSLKASKLMCSCAYIVGQELES